MAPKQSQELSCEDQPHGIRPSDWSSFPEDAGGRIFCMPIDKISTLMGYEYVFWGYGMKCFLQKTFFAYYQLSTDCVTCMSSDQWKKDEDFSKNNM